MTGIARTEGRNAPIPPPDRNGPPQREATLYRRGASGAQKRATLKKIAAIDKCAVVSSRSSAGLEDQLAERWPPLLRAAVAGAFRTLTRDPQCRGKTQDALDSR
jgi:hypothetical protein